MRPVLIFLLLGLCYAGSAFAIPGVTFTVDTEDGAGPDVNPGDGVCAASTGDCSLLAAVMEANVSPGTDTIVFSIGAGGAVATIIPVIPLPMIVDPVVIDGTTQGCPGPGPCIELMGHLIPDSDGLAISVGGSTVRGLAIGEFQSGILLLYGDGNVIESNFLGLDATGTVARGNQRGLAVFYSSNDNLIGGYTASAGNRIAANFDGINMGATGNLILSNVIGVDSPAPDTMFNVRGIHIIVRGGNTIGAPGAGNVISGNKTGISLAGTNVSNVSIRSNCIGPVNGCTTPFGNTQHGILLASSSNHTIGGTAAGEGNVISSNDVGIRLSQASNNVIQGNFIGTDTTGTANLGNDDSGGIAIGGESNYNLIGGVDSGARNLIAFNSKHGISLFENTGNTIRGNAIHSNQEDGIHVTSGAANTFQGNEILSNGLLGIDLAPTGVTPNDPGDADTGANDLQNYPVLSEATTNQVDTSIRGTLDSTPSSVFQLEFFANLTCDSSGHGEGATPIGTTQVTTNPGGIAEIATTVAGDFLGQLITATATNAAGSTSEFSACQSVGFDTAFGACCLDNGACIEVFEAECNGAYQGDDTTCTPDLCPQPEIGACCLDSTTCVEVPEAECTGTYLGDGEVCTPESCDGVVIPATSAWGLLILVLAMLGLTARELRRRSNT